MKYKFTVIPTSIGVVIGSYVYSLASPDTVTSGVGFGMICMLILMGISKQAEWK